MIISHLSDILSGQINRPKNYDRDREFQFFFSYHERPYAKRILIFIVESYCTKPRFVAKVSLDEISNYYLKNNFENLISLYDKFDKHPLLSSIPRPEFFGKIDGFNVFIEEFLPGKRAELSFSFRNSKQLLNLFVDWLIDFNLLTKNLMVLNNQLIKRKFKHRFDLLFENLGASTKLRSFFGCILDDIEKLSGKKIPILFCHGDFSIRNFVLNKGRLSVIDWEFSQKCSLALLDIFHLCVNSVWQLEKCSFDKCIVKAFFSNEKYSSLFRQVLKRYLNALEIEPVFLLPTFLVYLSYWPKYQSSVTLKVKAILETLADKKIELKFL